MRTVVFSDVHGRPEIITAVLEHSGFDPHADRLVFAGDAVDIGRDAEGCLDLLDGIGAECLVGNHEYAALVDYLIDDVPVSESVLRRIEKNVSSGRWPIAAEADGVLITHAGVSAEFLSDIAGATTDVARLVGLLNLQFRLAVEAGDISHAPVVEMGGPLWWRPGRYDPAALGVKQVVGHTPREIAGGDDVIAELEAAGVYLIDPNVRGWRGRGFAPPVPVRYAIIENGEVRVVDLEREGVTNGTEPA